MTYLLIKLTYVPDKEMYNTLIKKQYRAVTIDQHGCVIYSKSLEDVFEGCVWMMDAQMIINICKVKGVVLPVSHPRFATVLDIKIGDFSEFKDIINYEYIYHSNNNERYKWIEYLVIPFEQGRSGSFEWGPKNTST